MKYFLLLFLSTMLSAQSFEPIINNYTKLDYSGESPIWDIDYNGNNGEIYFANNRNILVYDGNFWMKLSNNNLAIVRSIFSKKGLVYSGSLNEFGYYDIKTRKYTSLSKQFKIFKNLEQEEIWKIFEFKNKIYFQSFNNLYVYDGKQVKKQSLPSLSSYIFQVDDKLLVATISKGIFEIESDHFKPLFQVQSNIPTVVHGIISVDNHYLIGTLKDGLFWVNKSNPSWCLGSRYFL